MSVARYAIDSPSVVIPACVVVLLERELNLGRIRLAVRGQDQEIDAVLNAWHAIAMQYERNPSSVCGHSVAPNADIVGSSRPDGFTAKQLARLHGVDPRTIRRYAEAGQSRAS